MDIMLGQGQDPLYNQDSTTPRVFGLFEFEGAVYCARKSQALIATAEFIWRKSCHSFHERFTWCVSLILTIYVRLILVTSVRTWKEQHSQRRPIFHIGDKADRHEPCAQEKYRGRDVFCGHSLLRRGEKESDVRNCH